VLDGLVEVKFATSLSSVMLEKTFGGIMLIIALKMLFA